jgi:hypothetical protein
MFSYSNLFCPKSSKYLEILSFSSFFNHILDAFYVFLGIHFFFIVNFNICHLLAKSNEMWKYLAEGSDLIQHEWLRLICLDHASQMMSSLCVSVEERLSYSLSNSEVWWLVEVFTQFGGSELRGICAGSQSAGFHTFCRYTHFGTGFACSREASLTLHQYSVHRSQWSDSSSN